MIYKNDNLLAMILLLIATLIKVWSLVTLYSMHAHSPEVPHKMEYKIPGKKPKSYNHKPIR